MNEYTLSREEAALIAELRAASAGKREEIIARYPALEQLAPVPVFAEWLGMRLSSIYAARSRLRLSSLTWNRWTILFPGRMRNWSGRRRRRPS